MGYEINRKFNQDSVTPIEFFLNLLDIYALLDNARPDCAQSRYHLGFTFVDKIKNNKNYIAWGEKIVGNSIRIRSLLSKFFQYYLSMCVPFTFLFVSYFPPFSLIFFSFQPYFSLLFSSSENFLTFVNYPRLKLIIKKTVEELIDNFII